MFVLNVIFEILIKNSFKFNNNHYPHEIPFGKYLFVKLILFEVFFGLAGLLIDLRDIKEHFF